MFTSLILSRWAQSAFCILCTNNSCYSNVSMVPRILDDQLEIIHSHPVL